MTATRTNDPSHVANKRRKRKRTTKTHPRRTPAPTVRNSNAGSPIASTRKKCMWNKKYKGYRFKFICNELEVAFKPRHKFTVELGGYADKENLESK